LETCAVTLPAGLAVHATTGTAVSADLLPYLAAVGGPLAITVMLCCAIRAVIFLVCAAVVIRTKDPERREACLRLAEIVSRGWPRLPRLPSG
jgi:hypothetical protein